MLVWNKKRLEEVDRLYNKEIWSLQRIGNKYGVSRERIRQIMERAGISRDLSRRGNRPKFKNLEEYIEYMKSGGKITRYLLHKLFMPRMKECEECGREKNLNLHYLSYPPTSLIDVQVLCVPCYTAKFKKGNGTKQQLKICNEYLNGKNGTELAKKHDVSIGLIYSILRKFNVERRSRKGRPLSQKHKDNIKEAWRKKNENKSIGLS